MPKRLNAFRLNTVYVFINCPLKPTVTYADAFFFSDCYILLQTHRIQSLLLADTFFFNFFFSITASAISFISATPVSSRDQASLRVALLKDQQCDKMTISLTFGEHIPHTVHEM